MAPGLRKFVLAAHLAVSVGWIGAIVAYVTLVVAAMTTQDAQTVQAGWIAMGLTIRLAIVPLALASLLTGLIMSLGTKWGLIRHYWVLISLLLTVFATVVLLNHVPSVDLLASVATEMDSADLAGILDEPGRDSAHSRDDAHMAGQLVTGLPGELLHAGGGLLVLLVVQVLNVYKPQGVTPYGWRKQQEERHQSL